MSTQEAQDAQGVPTTLPNPFHTFPHPPSIPITPYRINIPQAKVDDLKRRLDDAPTSRTTFENSHTDEHLGITRKWLNKATEAWKAFDWRKTEEKLNSFPNYTAKINHLDTDFEVHFIALFSRKPEAIPIVLTHGWPGSIIEFVPLIEHLSKTYTPDTLPVHVVFPSLIGYGFSSAPPLDRNFVTRDNSAIFNKLMKGLGFEKYIAQGGDVGSLVSQFAGQDFIECKAVHLNMMSPFHGSPDDIKSLDLDEYDKEAMERFEYFQKWEFAYKHEHATKSATIGFVLESSPIALLSWIGEKFIVWSDETPSLDHILANVSIYWYNQTISTGLYHYRSTGGRRAPEEFSPPKTGDKPIGYSLFKKEIHPIPRVWAENQVGNLVWFRRHDQGGHFAALERPEEFWEDVRDFAQEVWVE